MGVGAWLLGAAAATAGRLYVVSELRHGISGAPAYSSDFTLPSAANGYTGIFTLASTSPGRGQAAALDNFNAGTGSDVGAHQSGTPPMKFGVAAASAPPAAQLATSPSPASGQAPLTATFTSNCT